MNFTIMTTATMSSREISELTGKDHGDVLKDIRRILDEAEIDGGKFSGVYKGGNGNAYKQMRFTPDGVVWAAKKYAEAGQ